MRFSIRDVLWATVVGALIVCWSLERLAAVRQAQLSTRRQIELTLDIEKLQAHLKASENQLEVMRRLAEKRRIADMGVTE